ncbi:hypothetical protein [Leptospira interrogans]|uniref:hypothetical protein n=1 Tax=Leptospira interrogans TaxID=173 RepID=UPI001431DC51|nr:hypothetical protein [Leptospira interrogans]
MSIHRTQVVIDNHSTLLCRDEPANLPICRPDMVCPVLRDGQYSDHLTDQASYRGVIFDYRSLLIQRTSLIPKGPWKANILIFEFRIFLKRTFHRSSGDSQTQIAAIYGFLK